MLPWQQQIENCRHFCNGTEKLLNHRTFEVLYNTGPVTSGCRRSDWKAYPFSLSTLKIYMGRALEGRFVLTILYYVHNTFITSQQLWGYCIIKHRYFLIIIKQVFFLFIITFVSTNNCNILKSIDQINITYLCAKKITNTVIQFYLVYTPFQTYFPPITYFNCIYLYKNIYTN